MEVCLILLLLPCLVMSGPQDRRGENIRYVKINETRYFGDLLELALKDMREADVIFDYGGPELSGNISREHSTITLSNCKVVDIQNVTLNSTKYEIYNLYGWQYPFFTGDYYFPTSKLTYDYSIKNTSGEVLSSGVATLHLTRAISEVFFYVDNNSTGQYHILQASGMFHDLGRLQDAELTGTSAARVKKAVTEIFKKNELAISVIPTTALNYYILKHMRIVDFNDYIIRK